MTFDLFLILLAAMAVVTSLVTEGIKAFLNSAGFKYASNVVVLFVSVLVGGLGTCIYYVLADISFNLENVIYILLMVVANWLCSMVGYDKVVQAIAQLKKK